MFRGSRALVGLMPILSLVLCAALAAEAATALVAHRASRLVTGAGPSAAATSRPAPRRPGAPAPRPPPRNIFCSSCRPPPEAGDDDAAHAAIRSPLEAQLVATMIGAGAPPLAVIAQGPAARVRLLGVGERLAGEAVVVAIAPRRVLLRRAGRLELLAFGRDASATPRPAASSTAPAAGFPGLRRLGPERWELQRAAVQRLLADPRPLARSALVVPTRRGWLLRRVQPGGPLAALGLQSGDTLEAVNGQALGSPARDLELLARLLTASRLQLAVRRGGAALVHDYVVR